jgi:hypothetical protein
MRLYHSTLITALIAILLSACSPTPTPTKAMVSGKINVDGQTYQIQLIPGSTVQEALDSVDITLNSLDRIEPPTYTVLGDDTVITITRVWEEFEVEQLEIPFQQKRLPTELLPQGVEQFDPLQKGVPGLREITYRIVFEDGIEASRSQIKSVVVQEPQDQIILFGTQQQYSPLDIPGTLVYLSQGNAIMLDGNTANRIPIVSTGDLDGRIFSLSDDGEWFLFTRHGESDDVINTLWAVSTSSQEVEVDLQVENVIHFADWYPGSNTRIIYSTVEPRQAAPGWQANNDLLYRDFSENGWVSAPKTIIDTNSGGVYGWWGTDFLYSPRDESLAFVGPDQIGLVNFEEDIQVPLFQMTPFQTRSDWAWVPGLRWGPDGKVLYTVNHAPPQGTVSPEESPIFDLAALLIDNSEAISIVSHVGMFAYPLPSPTQVKDSGENGYQVAYLQAIFPNQSDSSRYRLNMMDRDGSNRREVFPPAESPGIEPSQDWGAWSPGPLASSGNYVVGLIYQGNIWLVDSVTSQSWQVTGDGLINRIIWQ